jgi:hypothetical protein
MDVRAWKNAVAGLGCGLCRRLGYGETPAELHHPREGVGKAQRASDWLVIPLCADHHRGSKGWHGTRDDFKRHSVNEWDILADTIEEVAKNLRG